MASLRLCRSYMTKTGTLSALRELGEWAAVGFLEGEALPWPRAYGLAFRRLYEKIEIRVLPDRLLVPCEPFPARLDAEHGGVWHAAGFVCDFNHYLGLRINRDIAELKKTESPQHARLIDDLMARLESALGSRDPAAYTHSNPDMRRIVGEGINAMEAELDREIAATRGEGLVDEKKPMPLLLALKDYVAGVREFHRRAVAAAWDAHEQTRGPRRQELALVARSLENALLKPATTFLEGLLAVNFAWMLDGCDSIGRIDQVLGPLFEKDLEAGRISIDLVRRLLDELFRNFERQNGWNMQIGGRTPDGRDGCNRLTDEIILACGRNHLRRPNVAFRMTRDVPASAVRNAVVALAEGSGRPALYNDDAYIEALLGLDLGLTPEDAREIAFGGCTETMIAGMSNVGSLEGYLNLAKWLELAMNNGKDPTSGQQAGPQTGEFSSFATFDEFMSAYRKQVEHWTRVFVEERDAVLFRRFESGDPKLYRTFFTRDCVKRRKSFEEGGARYNWAVVSYAGISNTIDSLAAIRKCVFEDRSISAGDLLAALKADYAGTEALRQKLVSVPKYGNNDSLTDALGRDVMTHAWKYLLQCRVPRGGRYVPSCILFATYEGHGQQVGATPDGRKAFTVLSDSVGPTPGRDTHGPTAALNSILALPLKLAAGTPVLNLRFQKRILQDGSGLVALESLIRSYFDRGGMQVQLTVVSSEEMREAQRHPEAHGDLIVRIGGYSEYFTRLSPGLQESVIARTEYGR